MSSSTRIRSLTTVLALACLAGVAACGNAVEKTGAPASDVTVLHLGAADTNDPQLEFFASTLEASSNHRLHVQVDLKTYFSETPGGEAELAGDLGTGKVDFGYLPSRDWAQAGATGFSALQAAGLLTTTAQATRLARDPIAAELLGGLGAKGVVGLGLVPEEARRLITRKPVLGADDLAGAQIRIGDNTQTAAMIDALGGNAVQGLSAGQAKAKLKAGELDGVETAPTPASQNSYNDPAPYLTSFGLIPKFEVLAVNQDFWRTLPSADQQLVQSAATATVNHAVTDVPAREADQLKLLCGGGAVIVRPSGSALKGIFTAASKARPTVAADTALITRIASAVDATGPQADAAPVPAPCPVATTAAAAVDMHRDVSKPVDTSTSVNPAQLVGTYQVDVKAQDWADGGARGPDFSSDVTFVWKLSADGAMHEAQKPDFPDQGPASGTWRVDGDHIVFDYKEGGDHFHETVTWSYFKGVLTLKPFQVQDQPSTVIYSVPWRKTT